MQASQLFFQPAPESGLIMLDEEWQRQTEISERRKAQNRLAQRNFRKRRSQQQKQQQQEQSSSKDSSSKNSYPSPCPSPRSSHRSVKSPDRDSFSQPSTGHGGVSTDRSTVSSDQTRRNQPVSPQQILSHNYLSLNEEAMSSPVYDLNHSNGLTSSPHGVYHNPYGGLEHSTMNSGMTYDSSPYGPQYAAPMYSNGIRPAIIPRTEAARQDTSTSRSAKRTSSSGLSIDLSSATSPVHMKLNHTSPMYPANGFHPQGVSPGLDSSASGQMSLHLSAEKGHDGVVRLLLDCGADPNGRDDYGSTPLHLAAKSGNGAVVQALLDTGADVNARNANGWLAVHIASKYGHENILRLLIERGADLHAKASENKPRRASGKQKSR